MYVRRSLRSRLGRYLREREGDLIFFNLPLFPIIMHGFHYLRFAAADVFVLDGDICQKMYKINKTWNKSCCKIFWRASLRFWGKIGNKLLLRKMLYFKTFFILNLSLLFLNFRVIIRNNLLFFFVGLAIFGRKTSK